MIEFRGDYFSIDKLDNGDIRLNLPDGALQISKAYADDLYRTLGKALEKE